MPVNPIGMSLQDWADSTILAIGDNYAVGRLDDEAEWKSWASGLVRSNNIVNRNPPNPYMFTDWREFAMRLYPMLEGLPR